MKNHGVLGLLLMLCGSVLAQHSEIPAVAAQKQSGVRLFMCPDHQVAALRNPGDSRTSCRGHLSVNDRCMTITENPRKEQIYPCPYLGVLLLQNK